MKISKERLELWQAAITPLDTAELRARYAARDIPRAATVRDIDTRYRFDLLNAAVMLGRLTWADVFGDGMNDAHRLTALRQIVPAIDTAEVTA